MRTLFSALLLIPCIASAQVTQLKNFVISPPYDGSRNSFLEFRYMDQGCEGYSASPKDVGVASTASGFELRFNVRFRQLNCSGNRAIERSIAVALPFVLPDTPLPNPLTLSVKLGDGRSGSISVEATRFPRARTVPTPALPFTWNENSGEQFIRAYVGETESRYQFYPDMQRNANDYCMRSKEEECFEILVCEQSGDIGLGTSQFGNNSPSCGRGAKRHLVFMGSPSALSISNEDGTGFGAVAFTGELSGRWQIVDPLAALKYGLTGIVLERATYAGSGSSFDSYRVSGMAGKGEFFCARNADCQLTLSAPARGNRSIRLNFPRSGITGDRIYRFTPFPDASANDLALGHYAGLGTWTLVMVRE